MEKGKRNPKHGQARHGRPPVRTAGGSPRAAGARSQTPSGHAAKAKGRPAKKRLLPKKPSTAGLSAKGFLIVLAADLGIAAWISYVLFNSYLGFLSFFPVFVFHLKMQEKREGEKAAACFDERYREFLTGLSSGLRAGHSLENAFGDAERNLSVLYGQKDPFVAELSQMNRQIAMNIPVEEVFSRFADRHPIEEVENMAEILTIGKRLGGNYVKNISDAAEKIRQSLELKAKIAALTAEKTFELRMMLILPPGLLSYIRFASPDFIAPIYGTVLGTGLVSVSIACYITAYAWGSKIVKIEV